MNKIQIFLYQVVTSFHEGDVREALKFKVVILGMPYKHFRAEVSPGWMISISPHPDKDMKVYIMSDEDRKRIETALRTYAKAYNKETFVEI